MMSLSWETLRSTLLVVVIIIITVGLVWAIRHSTAIRQAVIGTYSALRAAWPRWRAGLAVRCHRAWAWVKNQLVPKLGEFVLHVVMPLLFTTMGGLLGLLWAAEDVAMTQALKQYDTVNFDYLALVFPVGLLWYLSRGMFSSKHRWRWLVAVGLGGMLFGMWLAMTITPELLLALVDEISGSRLPSWPSKPGQSHRMDLPTHAMEFSEFRGVPGLWWVELQTDGAPGMFLGLFLLWTGVRVWEWLWQKYKDKK